MLCLLRRRQKLWYFKKVYYTACNWPDLRVSSAEQKGSFDSKVVTYGSIDAPPSFKPAKKYSDVSGLPAVYTDPQVGSQIQLFCYLFFG